MSRILLSLMFLLSFFTLSGEKIYGQPERVWRPFDIEKYPGYYLYMDGVNINGIFMVRLHVSKKGIIKNFEILRIDLKNGEDTVLFVSNVTPYKKIINKQYHSIDEQSCHDSIQKYVNQIILKPTMDTALYRNMIPCILPIRVRCKPIPKYRSELLNNYYCKKKSVDINGAILYKGEKEHNKNNKYK